MFKILASTLMLMISSSLWAEDTYRLPDIGDPSAAVLSPQQERELGESILRQINRSNFLLRDPELTEYVRSIGNRLANGASSSQRFQFYVINSRDINAFALPGGIIGINAGLILATRNESELAGVVAHEITHVTQRHIARGFEASQNVTLKTLATLLIAIALGAADPDAAQAALAIGLATQTQQRINFTRANELEADRIGIRLMARGGYDPYGMATFFEVLGQKSALAGNNIPEILRTHPVSVTRVSEAKNRAGGYTVDKVRDPLSWANARARIIALLAPDAGAARQHFAALINNQSEGFDPSTQYGYSLALIQTGDADKAIPRLRKLVDHNSTDINYRMALGRAYLATNQTHEALDTFAESYLLRPASRAVTLNYAEALLQTKHAPEARNILLRFDEQHGLDDIDFALLARASDRAGQRVDARLYQARYHFSRSEYELAFTQMDEAETLPKLSDYEKARIKANRQRLEEEKERLDD